MYNQIDSNKRKTAVLITIFLILIMALGWFLSVYYESYIIFPIAVIFSSVSALAGYYKGDKVALMSSGAKEIAKEDNPYVYRMVENMAITAGLPTPRVYIIDSPAMNAFATGRDPEHASIAVTTGLIGSLENEELEGVIAHELSHIKNYDIRLMTIVVVLVGMISLIADMFWRTSLSGRRSSNNKSGGLFLIIGLILLILSPIIAEIIKLAISRKREYLADASGALLTRYPEGLAKALEKISESNVPLKRASSATAHMFIANPFKKKSIMNMFSTHPPAQDRIAKLRSMA